MVDITPRSWPCSNSSWKEQSIKVGYYFIIKDEVKDNIVKDDSLSDRHLKGFIPMIFMLPPTAVVTNVHFIGFTH